MPHCQGRALVEAELAAGEVPYSILGPTYFFDNALGGVQQVRNGVLYLPSGPAAATARPARPRRALAAKVLLAPDGFTGQRIELAGDAPPRAEWLRP